MKKKIFLIIISDNNNKNLIVFIHHMINKFCPKKKKLNYERNSNCLKLVLNYHPIIFVKEKKFYINASASGGGRGGSSGSWMDGMYCTVRKVTIRIRIRIHIYEILSLIGFLF